MTSNVSVKRDEKLKTVTVNVGENVILMFEFDQLEKMKTWVNGGKVDMVLKQDLIEHKMVEAIEVDDLIYSKSDLRWYISQLGPKVRPA